MDNHQKRKRAVLKKSRYYRQRQKQIKTAVLAGSVLFLLLLLAVLALPRLLKTEQGNARPVSGKASSEALVAMEAADGPGITYPETPVTLTVSLAGDCTLGTDEAFDYSTSLNAYFDNQGSGYFFQNVLPVLSRDDLTVVNMEGTLTRSEAREDKLFAFKADPAYADILSRGSVEACTLANNHSKDYGEESFADTKAALDAAGITHFGYDDTAVMDVRGVKVGLVGIYELYDHMERAEQLKENIAKVKKEGAHIVIAVFHWGNEKETVPDSNQTALGRMAIDQGADLAVGHHPHVLQGVEKYKGKFIAYSLGNFCFGGNAYPSDMDSMIFQQTFTVTPQGVEANDDIRLIPCRISSVYDYNNYQPTLCEGEEADRILEKMKERSAAISDTMDFYFQP